MRLFLKLEEKYGQEYAVGWHTTGWGEEYIRIRGDYFEILIPENIKNKEGILIQTCNNTLYYYSVIDSIVNAVIRIAKKINKENGEK